MYCYLFDTFLRERQYEKSVHRVEARIAELGLQGKTERLSILKNAGEIVRDAVKKGVQTFVIVGDDSTIQKVLTYVAEEKVTLGIIPLGTKLEIADMLGIPHGEAACDTLSKRVIQSLDLGRINSQYFLRSLDIQSNAVQLESDQGYTISLQDPEAKIQIANFLPMQDERGKAGDPSDGTLEAIVSASPKKGFFTSLRGQSDHPSIFPFRKVKVTCRDASVPLVVDGEGIVKTPAQIEVVPHCLRVIVGRARHFAQA
ncbi:MAG: hypothetical protein H6760_04635 [Candidatus Nomurabacteria bacterium]|nr:MAG: hypothetical protein H6760_04635 [Candidatus Nomurabacteria bacterium]